MVARAARESGVPISDILENLPNELSVWVDPGEVSFRIGEKGAVKVSTYEEESYILISRVDILILVRMKGYISQTIVVKGYEMLWNMF